MFWLLFGIGVLATMVLHRIIRRVQSASVPSVSSLSKEQAAAILGIAVDASEADIQSAHHRLMKKLHPDQGGSDYLSQQINLARERMLQP